MNNVEMILNLIYAYIENVSKTITNLKCKNNCLEFQHNGNIYRLTIVKIKKVKKHD